MTLDGFCDHTAMIADEEIHQHYNELLSNAGTPYIRKDNISTYGKLLAICRKNPYW
jgi:hypothetical protein